MTQDAISWCQQQNIEVIPVDVFVQCTQPAYTRVWENLGGKVIWQSRKNWFKKPWAMTKTPFDKTVWIDLDCEILDTIEPLFSHCNKETVGLSPEHSSYQERVYRSSLSYPGEIIYNSGVMAFTRAQPLIETWARASVHHADRFLGDQDILSRLIFQMNHPVSEIDPIYNWHMSQGMNLDARIIHWVCASGKDFIRTYGGISKELLGFRSWLSGPN